MSIGTIGADLLSARWVIQILVTLTIPIFLLGHRLPHREDSLVREVIAIAALSTVTIYPVAAGYITGLDAVQSFLVFSLLLGVYALLLLWVFDASLWQTLFCATAGYTLQNLASGLEVLISILVSHRASGLLAEPWNNILGFGIPLVVYAFGYLVFIRQIDRRGLALAEDKSMLAMFIVVVFVIIGFDILIKTLVWDGIRFSSLVLIRLVHSLICAFVLFAEYEILYARRMIDEKAETERVLAERERQYRLSRENIEAINIKCHDLKHQIRALASGDATVSSRVLDEISREVDVYDSVVKSGNDALDTILTEKSLYCEKHGITLSCIADGAALDFVEPTDLYSFFGNALDNAIEAVERMADPERRSIGLVVRRTGDMVSIHVENYFDGNISFGGEGLPNTRKPDEANHGFGVRSMRMIAESLGGSLTCRTQEDVFHLDALLPIPAASAA